MDASVIVTGAASIAALWYLRKSNKEKQASASVSANAEAGDDDVTLDSPRRDVEPTTPATQKVSASNSQKRKRVTQTDPIDTEEDQDETEGDDEDDDQENGKEDDEELDEGTSEFILDVAEFKQRDRIEIFWPGDNSFYPAVIKKKMSNKKKPIYILYDDGFTEWIDPKEHKIRFLLQPAYSESPGKRRRRNSTGKSSLEPTLSKAKTSSKQERESEPPKSTTRAKKPRAKYDTKVSLLERGTRIALYSAEDDTYYKAQISSIRGGRKSHCVRYDDSKSRQWLDLTEEKFKILTEDK